MELAGSGRAPAGAGAGTPRNPGVRRHALVSDAWPANASTAQCPALPLPGLLDQQLHVRRPWEAAADGPGGARGG